MELFATMRSRNVRPPAVRSRGFSSLFPILVLISGLLSGCGLFLGRSSPPEEQYAPEYPSPAFPDRAPLDETVKVDRFVAAQAFSDTSMVYSSAPFKRDVYNYSWWDENPGDMVTDFILRDLRNSGLYRAVFSYRSDVEARFHLDGGIDEFLEVDGAEGSKAVVAVTVTLLDSAQKDVGKRVVFQKNYRVTAPMEGKTPQALARGMSAAMEQLSGQLQTDIYNSIKSAGKPA